MIREVSFSNPESPFTKSICPPRTNSSKPISTTWYGLVIILVALGVLGQAWIGYQGRTTGVPSTVEYYISLCLIFVPPAMIVVSRRSSAQAKVLLALYAAVALLATRYMLYPTLFAYHDEIVHEWNALAIYRTGHLFSPNAILPVTSYYPGLELATVGVQQLTGLPLHSAAVVVLVLVRIVMTLSLVRIIQRITGSLPLGTLAALVYSTNPQYIFFNSQFSYQTVALPLCFFCIYVFSIRRKSRGLRAVIPSAAVVLAVAVTHHLTSLALVVLIWTWYLLTRITRRHVSQLLSLAVISTMAVGTWTWVARSVVVPYIRGILQSNLMGVVGLFRGTLGHTLFSDSAGDRAPEWEAFLSLAAILVVASMLIPALWFTFKRLRSLSAAALVLAISAAAYPIVPAGHLAAATGETADRASGFIFVGLGYLFASWWLSEASYRRHSKISRFRVPRRTWLLVLGLTVCFTGGTIDGSGPDWAYGPGRYLVSADNRSVDQLALQAASWEGSNLPAHSRVFTDRVNAMLAQTYGNQDVLTSLADGIKVGTVSQLLLAKAAPDDVGIVCENRIQFLIADRRLSASLPHLGQYIDNGEYLIGTRTAPPPVSALAKFDNVLGAERIFDNGAIRIYDLRGIACPR